MTHWGEALSLLTNPYSPPTQANLRKGRALLDEAKRLGARNERESAYVEALSIVFAGDDLAQHRARLGAYRDAMARLNTRFPDDTEAAIQYALVLGVAASPTDKTYADQLRGAAILEREWQRQPEHPGIVHYLIHLYDYPPLAERGVRAAERYADLAADAPHALHMPSHIFTRVGRWDGSVETNRRAAERAVAAGEPEASSTRSTTWSTPISRPARTRRRGGQWTELGAPPGQSRKRTPSPPRRCRRASAGAWRLGRGGGASRARAPSPTPTR